ncbi:restriction endonuclease [Belliella sp. DSM 107340]|uniref:Restriction endonuclease n=1 Tax=Belliella calami TaxID=2923436 RepID=A0ABS9UR40_9BACT|nr:restriction endonuclease [Belliella calami]MCH7398895.1 restriction endonuclease [Belliella calami]
MATFPKREYFFKPVLLAIQELGGSGTNEEINNKVIESLKITDDLLTIMHKNTNQTEFEYQMAWVRTMLKSQGLLENSSRGVWSLNNNSDFSLINPIWDKKMEKQVNEEVNEEEDWKEKVLNVIIENLSPSGFERLIQRLLREKGFTQVEVTGRSGDGGIDGRGIARINGILSFHIIFQCKRYKNSSKVGSKDIRDFRGAMVGRTDKGLFITTASFTRDAILEATRDGAPTIDLMDGDKLAEKLKELNLGLKVELKESVTVDESWFKSFDAN